MLCSSAVFEAGGHATLIKQLRGGGDAVVAHSAAALRNMAGEEAIRFSMLSHGAIRALVKPLKSTSTQVLVNTVRCLEVLACDRRARAQVSVGVCKTFGYYATFSFTPFHQPQALINCLLYFLFPSYGLLEALNHLSSYSDHMIKKCCKMLALLSTPSPAMNAVLLIFTNLGKTLK